MLLHRFGTESDQIGQGRAEPEAGEESRCQQAVQATGVCGPEGEHAEQDDRCHQDFLAADSVGDAAAEEGARQQADDAGTEHPAHHRRVQVEGGADASGGNTGRLQVEPFDQGDDEAKQNGEP
ncbi:hypothetical protein D9M69_492740 [compost metagenome]